MMSSKVHKNVTHWKRKLFWKLILSGTYSCHVSTLPIHDTTFLFDSFPPIEGEIAPKEKSFTHIFSITTVNFRNFFYHRIHLTGASEGAEICRLRVGSKTNFRNVCFLCNKLVIARESSPVQKIWATSFPENGVRNLKNLLGVSPQFIYQCV